MVNEYDKYIGILIDCVGMPMEEDALNTDNAPCTNALFTKENACAEFQHQIAVFSNDNHSQKPPKVTGGILLKYSGQNYTASRASCLHLFDDLYRPIKHPETQYCFTRMQMGSFSWPVWYFSKPISVTGIVEMMAPMHKYLHVTVSEGFILHGGGGGGGGRENKVL